MTASPISPNTKPLISVLTLVVAAVVSATAAAQTLFQGVLLAPRARRSKLTVVLMRVRQKM